MSWVAVAIGGASLVSSLINSQGAQDASQSQVNAGNTANQQLYQIGQNVSGMYTPYQNFGQTALNQMGSNLPYLTSQQPQYKPFTASDLNANLAPNYEFMKQQGQGATIQNANVGGGGSNVNLANQKFTQDYASNAYQNALQNYMSQQSQGFNQTQAQKTQLYNMLSGNIGTGSNAVQGSANAQLGVGTNIANITQGIGNAQAAGQVGVANAYSGGAQGLGNAGLMYGLLNSGQGNLTQQYSNPNLWGA